MIFEIISQDIKQFFKYEISINSVWLKGGLISESFSLWLKSPNKGAKSLMNTFFFVQSAQENDLTPYLGDLSQWERLSEIKLALVKLFRYLFSDFEIMS